MLPVTHLAVLGNNPMAVKYFFRTELFRRLAMSDRTNYGFRVDAPLN